ncbi:MAG TPA: acetate kinase, partial [bacterium]|nr:acetate kinase [bacterium]
MKILTVNSGSSSLKFKVFSMRTDSLLASGKVERIGQCDTGSFLIYKNLPKNLSKKETINATTHSQALEYVLKLFEDPEYGCLEHIDDIIAVGHRVVHGKDVYNSSILITKESLEILKS